jgi:hypothetical protein
MALPRAQGGRGLLNCLLSVQGTLVDCAVIDEFPPDKHFGDAALALAPLFLLRPAKLKGRPVVAVVDVPVLFYMEPPEPLPPPAKATSP